MRPPKTPAPVSDDALREALHRQAQPLRQLPAAWWEPGVTARIAAYMKLREKLIGCGLWT